MRKILFKDQATEEQQKMDNVMSAQFFKTIYKIKNSRKFNKRTIVHLYNKKTKIY